MPPTVELVTGALEVVEEFDQLLQVSQWAWFMGGRNLIASSAKEYHQNQLLKFSDTMSNSYLGEVVKIEGNTVVLRRVL